MKTLEWVDGSLRLIDQTRLPWELVVLECRDHHEVAAAIREMRVRGAPAIGVAAAFGVALGMRASQARDRNGFLAEMHAVCEVLRATRPTASNLFWALERLKRVVNEVEDGVAGLKAELLREAQAMAQEDEEANRCIGAHGAALVNDGDHILTHCNAGALATVAYGTALGVIRAAHEQGKRVHVFVDETRPLLQGARLTAWELGQEGIPFTLITDSMAGHFMQRGRIDLVVVGADRIAANGDFANKIGTYSLAVLAKENSVPFYTAAPTSTIDLSLATGAGIPIEERDPGEVLTAAGQRIAPEGAVVANPAFDVTPRKYLTAIITEAGLVRPPFAEGLKRAVELAERQRSQRKEER